MTKASKAALLSALVFPGVGHLYLRRRWRGAALVLTAIGAVASILSIVAQRAQTIADQIVSGTTPLDPATIARLVSESSQDASSAASNTAVAIFLACWVLGVIDAYRIGSKLDRQGPV